MTSTSDNNLLLRTNSEDDLQERASAVNELTAENVLPWLVDRGLLAPSTPAMATALSWGVSNAVIRVDLEGGRSLVVKQSRPQLRTQAEWFSQIERVYCEVEAQRALDERLPERTVPTVLFEDRIDFAYVMTAVSAEHSVWKGDLLSDRFDADIAEQAGRLLGQIHVRTFGQPDVFAEPMNRTVFDELRLDPFYRRIAAVHPEIAPAVHSLIDETLRDPICLVHADFSPKNLLVHEGRLTLVDFETCHWGDPAFDLGFFFAHLCLKVIRHERYPDMVAVLRTAWDAYCRETAASGLAALRPEVVGHRGVLHLAGNMLARVDGKSLVDYLSVGQQQVVRELTLRWWRERPGGMGECFDDVVD